MIKTLKHAVGEFDNKLKIPLCIWPHFDLLYVHSGKMFLRLMKKDEISLSSGQAVLIFPATFFQGYSMANLSQISVHHFLFPKTKDKSFSSIEYLREQKNNFEIFKNTPVQNIDDDIKRIVKIAGEKESIFTQDRTAALMLLILTQLKINSERKYIPENQSKFASLLLWIRKNMRNKLTLKDMADELNMSTSHFRVLFKSEIGISPGNYLVDLRMKEAARQLRETLVTIKEIADEAGFNELPHFYRAFKLHYQTTPKKYRAKYILRV